MPSFNNSNVRQMHRLVTSLAVVLEDAQTTLPVPALVSDGGDVSGWRTGDYSPLEAEVKLTAASAVTLSNAEVFEWDGATWSSLGLLNNGNDITLTATRSFKHPLYGVSANRLAIAGTLSSPVAVSATATPRELA